jgi:hypothetical protein
VLAEDVNLIFPVRQNSLQYQERHITKPVITGAKEKSLQNYKINLYVQISKCRKDQVSTIQAKQNSPGVLNKGKPFLEEGDMPAAAAVACVILYCRE